MRLGYLGRWPDRKRMDIGSSTYPKIEWSTPWLVLYGTTGSGKTAWTLDWIISNAEGWEYFSTVEIIDWLRRASKNELSVNDILRNASETPVMVVDDLGAEPPEKFSDYGTEYMPHTIIADILYRRHASKLKTIISTNLDPRKIKEKYADRIFSRMMELSTWVRFTGDRRQHQSVKVEVVK